MNKVIFLLVSNFIVVHLFAVSFSNGIFNDQLSYLLLGKKNSSYSYIFYTGHLQEYQPNQSSANIICPQDAGTFDIIIDGVNMGSSCGSFDLDSNSEIEWVSNGDQDVGSGGNSGMVFLFYDTDPSGFDLDDVATFTTHPNLLAGFPDNSDPYTFTETNCVGISGTDEDWPSTVWVMVVTADYASGIYFIDTDMDECWDVSCITELNYIYTDYFELGCGDDFYDTGGPSDDYCNNEITSWLICPDDPDEVLMVEFSDFDSEGSSSCTDELSVYDGDSDSDPLLGSFCEPGLGPFMSTHPSGCLYFVFTSDDANTDIGWEAEVSCYTCPQDAGTFDVYIDGVNMGSSCGEFDLDSNSEIEWVSTGDQNVGSGGNSGIVFLFYDADPSGFDFDDIATFTTHPNLLAGFPDSTDPYTVSETNCVGISGTDENWPSTVWVMAVTADYASGIYFIDTDLDGCWAVSCITQLNYIYTDYFELGCGDDFYDSGGIDNDYCNNEITTYLICPDDPDEILTVTFDDFDTEGSGFCYDEISVYDGDSDSDPLIGSFCEPGLGPFTSTHPTGCLLFVFTSDATITEFGWEASISCEAPPCLCEDPVCGGMHWDCFAEAESDYDSGSSNASQYDIIPDLIVGNGGVYELCYEYTTGPEEEFIGFVNDIGTIGAGCTYTTSYHVYESGCGSELSSMGPSEFGNGFEYDIDPNTNYIFCVEITITSDNCEYIDDTYVWLYDAAGLQGCGSCSAPCLEDGMGMVPTYDDSDLQSCWIPDCPVFGPGIFTNCFEAQADDSGFLGFTGSIVNQGSSSCIDISWELSPTGDCSDIIDNPVPNANGESSGFNPEYTGLVPDATYVLCINYDLSNTSCGFDGISDEICIDAYGNDCAPFIDADYSSSGFFCQYDGESLEDEIGWNLIDFDAGPMATSDATIGFLVFCSPPDVTDPSELQMAFDAILETFDQVGDFINDDGDYVDPFNPSQVCSDQIFLVPITIYDDDGFFFYIDWDCYATSEIIEITLGVSPDATISADASSICSGAEVDLTAGGGGTYTWSNGLGSNEMVSDMPDNTTTYYVTVTDDSGNCTDIAEITIEVVELDYSVLNIECNDNGTPSDPSDDTFSFDIEVTGINVDPTGWTADDPNLTWGNYGSAINFGPFDISDGSINFTITDNGLAGCSVNVTVDPPPTCSEACDISNIVDNIFCNDNGTPSDPSDDTFTFGVLVSGVNNSATWTATDPDETTGFYTLPEFFGPFNISDGDLSFIIIDDDDPNCTTNVFVEAPEPCSDECVIEIEVSNIQCNNNGTPSDDSDDTFSFDVLVTGSNISGGWSSDDPNNTSGDYDVFTNLGPFDISDGSLTITFVDNDNPDCEETITIDPPNTCSNTCSISNTVSNILCDDNGTPSDPSDDTYSFDIIVVGSNLGPNWSADDPNSSTGLYGITVNMGPYNIADGDLSFTITDEDDSACTTLVNVTAPEPCSDLCDIMAEVLNILCDDNGTPSDPSDDTFTFDVIVTGSNTGNSWNANDPNSTTGSYNNAVSFGPYQISNGDFNFSITDINDPSCSASIEITAPETCSDLCDINAEVSNIICDDNGTPSDPTDDTFSFDVIVSGNNTGLSWTADDPNSTSGAYGSSIEFGPYPIADGDLSFIISDIDDPNCTSAIEVIAPPTCSDECEIMVTVNNIICNDNGTPTNPDDDTFTFDILVTGSNVSSAWSATDPNSTSGSYDISISFGPYDIADGDLSFMIIDSGDPSCSINLMIEAPETCSEECEIEVDFFNIACNDNGTPSDPDDDTFTFDVIVTGNNTGTNWEGDDPNNTTGLYDVTSNFGPFNIDDGNITITITDEDDPDCSITFTVIAPNTCSGTCSISHNIDNIVCDDNGTPSDPDDDTFSFDIIVTGSNIGASWLADDPNSSSGLYGVNVSMGPFNISDGELIFTISDIDDPDCTTFVGIDPPEPCSDLCEIDAEVSNILCDDNGTPSDPDDDTFSFDVIVTGNNTGSSWTANDPNTTSGAYDITVNFGPYPISDGDFSFSIIDGNDSGCTIMISIMAPETCSDQCEIEATFDNIICDDNGTPSDPSDDTYTFDVIVNGANTSASWTANDQYNTNGNYDQTVNFGPYSISSGDLVITITDDNDPDCFVIIEVSPPETCSDLCEISATVINILCDDNGTPSDPDDDTFSFDVTVTGNNTASGWSATDPNSTTGSYDVTISFGPYPISGGNISFEIIDNADDQCSVNISVEAPETCSDQCEIEVTISNIVCNDNGTPSNPDDDTFTFDVFVTGVNIGTSWNSNDPSGTGGNYDETTTLGPFDIADGNPSMMIFDNETNGCLVNFTVIAPDPCSGTCSISNIISEILCDDNGTPTDPDDDTFTFIVEVNGSNTANSWTADDPNNESGDYGDEITFGPFDISDGDIDFTITDDDAPDCTTIVSVDAPETCSDQCEITYELIELFCGDNGTPSDPDDDVFFFILLIDGINVGSSWEADDENYTSGSYGLNTHFGPYDIDDGDISFEITDLLNPDCVLEIDIEAPEPCSDACSIEVELSNILCNDNGTPSDPDDDTYTFNVFVTGVNNSSSWNADDDNNSFGVYDQSVTLGPYLISDGDISFTIFDQEDSDCQYELEVDVPEPCSEACDIEAEVLNIICLDNGTPSDPSDDLFEFEVLVEGINISGGWEANDPEETTGFYSIITTFGPYSISGGDLNFTINDNSDVDCSINIEVEAPDPCSEACELSITFTNIVCNDNGTPSDPSDDTFTFEVLPEGINTSGGWSANDPNGTTGLYDVSTIFGPYNIANGNLNIVITDEDNPSCFDSFTVIAPNTCSGTCSISNALSNYQCDDNGTPSDPSDDVFTFDILVNGSNNSAGWNANDPNATIGVYGTTLSFGPYNISDGNFNFSITDDDDPDCFTNVQIIAPESCSEECEIGATITNIICDDNGTMVDPSDDLFTIELLVTGFNIGNTWTANDPNSSSGSYNVMIEIGPYLISDGDFSFDIIDGLDGMCIATLDAIAPEPCSTDCQIDWTLGNINCMDNGTPTDPADDLFTFEIVVTGNNSSSSWAANDAFTTSGAYGETVLFGPYPISNGSIDFTISDSEDMSCSTELIVNPPSTCSDECEIIAMISNIECDDNGTPDDPDDDSFTFDLLVTGSNVSGQWQANDIFSTSGSYDMTKSMGPYNSNVMSFQLIITDSTKPDCSADINVQPPNCSCTEYPDSPVVEDQTYCLDDIAVQLTAVGQNLLWYDSNGQLIGDQAPLPNTSIAGSIQYYVSQINDEGCESELAKIIVKVHAPPTVNAGTDLSLTCLADDIFLSGSIQIDVNDAVILWTGPGIISGQNTLSPQVDQFGVYTISVTDLNTQCSNFDEVELSWNGLEMSADILAYPPDCADQATGSLEIISLENMVLPLQIYLNDEYMGNEMIMNNLAPGYYEVKIIDAQSCVLEHNIDIPNTEEFVLQMEAEDYIIDLGDSTLLTVFTDIDLAEVDTIIWHELDNCSNCFSQVVSPISDQTYSVTLIDIFGCEKTVSLQILVDTNREILIPNIFSPNQDGNNDEYIISLDPLLYDIEFFYVYDRWGNLVFSHENNLSEDTIIWDGRFNGKKVSSGVYAFILKYQLINGESDIKYGDITLIR